MIYELMYIKRRRRKKNVNV